MGWHSWDEVSDGRAQPGSPISVVARKPDHLDLFITDKDGLVRTTWWDAASDEWADWYQISGGRARPGSLVSVVAPDPNHLDIFVTGTDGRIYATRWGYSPKWEPWRPVSAGRAQLGSPIGVVARKPDHLDLFVTDDAGQVKTTWSAGEGDGRPEAGEVQLPVSLPILPRWESHDPVVERVQHMLNATGLVGPPKLAEDGVWGSKTKNAVESFQKNEAVPGSGKVDKATWAALLHWWLRPDMFG